MGNPEAQPPGFHKKDNLSIKIPFNFFFLAVDFPAGMRHNPNRSSLTILSPLD